MAEQRFIPRQSLSREEISKLTDEEIDRLLSDQQKRDVYTMTRATFDQTPPKKREDESTGEYRVRLRRSKGIDLSELGRQLRLNSEAALYNSKPQKAKRLVDNLSANITAESVAENAEAEKQRAEKDRLAERESGEVLRPLGFGPFVKE